MLQELTDLDFDTYFDVASSNQQSQQQNHRDILYHGGQQNTNSNNNSINTLLNSTSTSSNNSNNGTRLAYPSYATQQQQQQQQQSQQNFNLFDWNLNPQQQQELDRSPMQISPISSPQSSSDGYTSHSLSPQMNSPPLYSTYNNQHIKVEANKALAGFFAKRSIYPPLHQLQNVPGINIPSTPTTENPPVGHLSTNLPSPPLEDNPLSGAFSTIDQWCQLKGNKIINLNLILFLIYLSI
jgi:hypothetical protein